MSRNNLTTGEVYYFSPFRLDERAGQLWNGTESKRLRPKSFALLQYLIARAGQLVSKDELLSELWPGIAVSEAGLTVCVRELRLALGDNPRAPRFIETAHRRGYRFIAPVTIDITQGHQLPHVSRAFYPGPILVGREAQLARLHQCWDLALRGVRQLVFVTGEPGIGKTALVDRFLDTAQVSESALLGRGQCVEQYGEGEPYLPLLEALGRMCRATGASETQEILRRRAPSWLVHMPGLIDAAEAEAVNLQAAGTGRERMLREMAEVLELLAATRPLVLVCEDMQVSDRCTIELLSYLAQRRGPARLLIIGTYRDAEVQSPAHPLRGVVQELLAHHQCEELQLELLNEAAVAEYIRRRAASDSVSAALINHVYRRTEGNALFMVTVVEYLLAQEGAENSNRRPQGDCADLGIPVTIRKMIEKQLERLSGVDRRLLEVASVAGLEFSAAAVRAGLDSELAPSSPERVEEWCERLVARTSFLCAEGIARSPDGTLTVRYRFRHSLYREVLYDRLGAGRRGRLHQRIGEQMEAAYGARAGEIAAELALHFERAGDDRRAVKHLAEAAENALGRSANQAAAVHAEKGLALLRTQPNESERLQHELRLNLILGTALMATLGMAAPEVERVYQRAQEVVRQIGATPALVPALLGIARFRIVRAELAVAHALAQRCLRLAQDASDAALLLEAHATLGAILYSQGVFGVSRVHSERAIALYDPREHRSHALLYGLDPGVVGRAYVGMSLWKMGYPDQAQERAREAVALGKQLSHAHSWSLALAAAASISARRRDWFAEQAWAAELISLTAEYELRYWRTWGTFYRGQALAEQGQLDEGIALMREAIAAFEASGAEHVQALILYAATAVSAQASEAEERSRLVGEALEVVRGKGQSNNEEAELHRIAGMIALQSGCQRRGSTNEAQAEACFLKALETARRQGARSLELRAAMNLSRLWRSQGKHKPARQTLVEIYNWFTEGFDTADLKEAKALIAELSE